MSNPIIIAFSTSLNSPPPNIKAGSDLIGAVRHEHYSDAGNSTVPKIGFFWQPIDRGLTIRGTFSKSFTAPPLYQEYGPVNFRLGGPAIITNTFGIANNGFQAEDGGEKFLFLNNVILQVRISG